MNTSTLMTFADPYPQRRDWRELAWLDRLGERVRTRVAARLRATPRRLDAFVARVAAASARLEAMDGAARMAELAEVRRCLRRDGYSDDASARAFAFIRHQAGALLDQRHFPTQIKGGYVLLHGYLAEMATGEGKTLTATLPAATAALAGRAVHVVTVNDYLAERDVEHLGPLYRSMGLSTGLVLEGMQPDEKREQYRADIVYCTNKTLVFDYLRDRIALGARMKPLTMSLDAMLGRGAGASVMLRGLQYAIVDEADSVFIDEARTPLIISAERHDAALETWYRQALMVARQLDPKTDFVATQAGRRHELTAAGQKRLAAVSADLGPLWSGRHRREDVVRQALAALYGFALDIHYIIRKDKDVDKVMIVDENTGRVMPDRSWEQGLQQLIEIKEGVPVSAERETLARISYQLFFRRYLRLSGMTGTCREVAGEVGDVYGLSVVRIPTHKAPQRITLKPRVHADSAARWHGVIEAVRARHRKGQPVLVGTRSIRDSEHLSGLLDAAGIPHRVLNAKQDAAEADIVARAGVPGAVMLATNMAGRGTDIKLADEVLALGGLHVILSERHDNARVDRQLVGRCARQGDPGSWQALIALDDDVMHAFMPGLARRLADWLRRAPGQPVAQWLGRVLIRLAQMRIERAHRKIRRGLLSADFRTRNSLSFTGQME